LVLFVAAAKAGAGDRKDPELVEVGRSFAIREMAGHAPEAPDNPGRYRRQSIIRVLLSEAGVKMHAAGLLL
jgi:hypothetical protein